MHGQSRVHQAGQREIEALLEYIEGVGVSAVTISLPFLLPVIKDHMDLIDDSRMDLSEAIGNPQNTGVIVWAARWG